MSEKKRGLVGERERIWGLDGLGESVSCLHACGIEVVFEGEQKGGCDDALGYFGANSCWCFWSAGEVILVRGRYSALCLYDKIFGNRTRGKRRGSEIHTFI